VHATFAAAVALSVLSGASSRGARRETNILKHEIARLEQVLAHLKAEVDGEIDGPTLVGK